MLRRVRKEEVQVTEQPKRDGISVCLDCWKLYMDSDDRDLSASRMKLAAGDTEDGHEGYESDPYGDQRKADMKIGEATNAMIDDLKPAHRWAIYKACGVTTVWNFPSVNYLDALSSANADLEKKLRNHIATATVFD
jgi:hypothetical protein